MTNESFTKNFFNHYLKKMQYTCKTCNKKIGQVVAQIIVRIFYQSLNSDRIDRNKPIMKQSDDSDLSKFFPCHFTITPMANVFYRADASLPSNDH